MLSFFRLPATSAPCCTESRCNGETFITVPMMLTELVWLVLVPVSAYPVSRIRNKGENSRDKERNLAFVMNLAGYVLALLTGIFRNAGEMLRMILWGYFLAVIFLTLLNRLGHIRASGHACSCTLPYLFFGRFLGIRAAVVCAGLWAAEFWASVRLKRHTVKEFLLGSLTAAGTFVLAVCCFR